MFVKFYNYDEDDTDVYVSQDTMVKNTIHIAIENDGGGEGIYLYMSEKEIQGFINKLQESLDNRKKSR